MIVKRALTIPKAAWAGGIPQESLAISKPWMRMSKAETTRSRPFGRWDAEAIVETGDGNEETGWKNANPNADERPFVSCKRRGRIISLIGPPPDSFTKVGFTWHLTLVKVVWQGYSPTYPDLQNNRVTQIARAIFYLVRPGSWSMRTSCNQHRGFVPTNVEMLMGRANTQGFAKIMDKLHDNVAKAGRARELREPARG
jgi:hypothetical protein